MEDLVKVFKALSDETRLKILLIISKRTICQKGISRHLGISESAVSQHIKVLKESGIVTGIKQGYSVIYVINDDCFKEVKFFLKMINDIEDDTFIDKEKLDAIPVSENKGMESVPFGHFGSAPEFVICDLESNEVKSINNGDLGHEHGKCQPLKALEGNKVDAIIVGGIGAGAIMKLNAMGTKVYRGVNDTIEANLKLLQENKLQELSKDDACSHNHSDGGCAHGHGHNINL